MIKVRLALLPMQSKQLLDSSGPVACWSDGPGYGCVVSVDVAPRKTGRTYGRRMVATAVILRNAKGLAIIESRAIGMAILKYVVGSVV